MLPPWTDDARARADDKSSSSSSAAACNASAAATAAPRQQQQQAATYVSADTNDNVGSSSSRRQGDATAASAATVTTPHDTNNNNDDDADNALTSLFAHGQPKDVLAGVRDGVRNAVLGVGSGLLSLVAAPVVGAREDGVVGALRGVAVGAVGAAAMTTYGVVTGVRQLCIGAANTPQALQAVAHGEQLWDSTLQQWHTVQLQRELDELPVTDEDVDAVAREAFAAAQRARAQAEAEAEADAAAQDDDKTTSNNTSSNNNNSSDGSEQTTRTTPRDDGDYYAILGVSRTATATELRRAYMQQALLLHPDRNAGNAQATQQFQQLQQAYKTLSNPSARVVYDQLGSSNSSGGASTGTATTATATTAAAMAAMSAADTDNPIEEVLAVSFLEPLVGRLAFLDYFRSNVLYNTAQRRELYRRRRLRMARTLCSFLDREGGGHHNSSSGSSSSSSADESNDIGFAAAREVLHDAVGTRLGPQLVGFVAQQYAAVARQHLHNSTLLRELDSWFTSKTITAAFLGNLATTTAGSTLAMARQRRLSEAEVNQLLVLAVEVDVKRTVARACRLVLYDRSVSDAQRQRRATRLAALAQLAQREVDMALASQSSLSSATA